MLRVPPLSLVFAISLAWPALARSQDLGIEASVPVAASVPDTYPEAAIDRPGILPFFGFLITTDAMGTREGGEVGQSAALGLGGRLELTLEVRRSLSAGRGSESLTPGLGVLAVLEGPIEVDARLGVPLFLSGPGFRGFTLGPATSLTFNSRFVLGAFSDLLVVETEPTTRWMLPVDLGLGFQATRKLFLELGTCVLTYDGGERSARTLLDESPVALDGLWSITPAWDVGIALAVDDARHSRYTWSAGMHVTWKGVR